MDKENSKKIILSLCGGTGAWERPYKDAGYEVINVTLPEYDVRTYIPPINVYGILAAPPCTEFSRAKQKNYNHYTGMELIEICLKIIWRCENQKHLKFWALENPYGRLRYFLGNPPFEFQPYEFGDGWSKRTCIWGRFTKPIRHKKSPIPIKKFNFHIRKSGYPSWDDCRRSPITRAITPPGFARAFFKSNQ